MTEHPDQGRRRSHNRSCGGCGCGGFLVVLTLGIALSLFNLDVGVGLSARLPFTQSNVTAAASIGAKQRAASVLPEYTHGRLGGNQNLVNYSLALTVGPAEGTGLVIVGRQEGAPVIDLRVRVLR